MNIPFTSYSWATRVVGPAIMFIAYCILAKDNLIIILTIPLFLSIIYFSSIEKDKFINEFDIINIIFFLFFVITPLQVIDEGSFTTRNYYSFIPITPYRLIISQAIVLVFYNVVMYFLKFRKIQYNTYFVKSSDKAAILLFSILCIAFVLHIISYGGIGNLLASRYFRETGDVNVTMMGWKALIIVTSVMLTAISFGADRSSLFQKLICIAGLFLLAISVNPFNIARNVFFGAWLPIFIIIVRGRITPFHMYASFALVITVFMPIFNFTSREGYTLAEATSVYSDNLARYISAPFSDTYGMLVACVWWFEDVGFYWGQKTLGLLLFLVPRSFWTSKATLTGLDIGDYIHSAGYTGTDNLSFFVGGDFYADFGIFGVLLGAILTYHVLRLSIYKNKISVNGWPIKNLLFMGALPILIRGPLGANVGLFFFEILFVSILIRVLPLMASDTLFVKRSLRKPPIRTARQGRSRLAPALQRQRR